MSDQPYREELHERDTRVVKQTIFGTTWTYLISIFSVGPVFLFALIGIWALWFQKERRPRALFVVYDDIVFCYWLLVLLWQDALPAPRRTVHHHLERLWIGQTWSILAGQRIRERLCRVRGTEHAVVYPQPTDHRDGSGHQEPPSHRLASPEAL